MPKYRNTDSVPRDFPGEGSVPAGMYITTRTDAYIYPCPSYFELVEDAPNPFEPLWDGPISSTVLSGLLPYVQFTIQNGSGAQLSVIVNGDSENPVKINDGLAFPLESRQNIERLEFSGAGTGDIQVYAVKGNIRKHEAWVD